MTPLHNKILCEVSVELGEKKSASGIVLAQEQSRFPFVEATVVSAGPKVNRGLASSDRAFIDKGDVLIVFNVFKEQFMEYEGHKYIFVNYDDGFFFKK